MNQTISFPNIFNVTTGKVNLESGKKSIDRCLYLLLNSTTPELLGDPMFGSDVIEHVFDYEGALLEEMVRSKILNAVNLYERRIEMNSEDITFTYEEESVIINMRYYIKAEGVYSTFSLAMLGGRE